MKAQDEELPFVLNKLAINVDKAAKSAYQRFQQLLAQGLTPHAALAEVYLSFSAGSLNMAYAEAMAVAFTDLLKAKFTPDKMLDYSVGPVKLSQKLYQNGLEVSKKAEQIIKDHTKVMFDLRNLSLDLFSGYNQKSVEVLKVGDVLPEYLKATYAPFAKQVDIEFAKLTASNLQTAGLRAAYSAFLKKLEKGAAKKALENALRTSVYEKSRYLGGRISQTEAARAYSLRMARELKARNVDYVQWRLSGAHKKMDVCDHFAGQDTTGLGSGIYRKDDAPIAPLHPFCRCRLIGLVNVRPKTPPEIRPDAGRAYYDSLDEEQQKQVYPSEAMRKQIENGGDLIKILNTRNQEGYKIKTMGEIAAQ